MEKGQKVEWGGLTGEFVCYDRDTDKAVIFIKDLGMRFLFEDEFEIVKSGFKSGDVVTYKHPNGNGVMRVESIDEDMASYFSMLGEDKECIVIDSTGIHFSSFAKANQDQIKHFELEEMKAGKKWNGEDYDDWLTADGLTLNELILNDLDKIEYNDTVLGWIKSDMPKKHWLDEDTCAELNPYYYRLKPEPGFVDVEIDWEGGYACIENSDTDLIKINMYNVGACFSFGNLQGYLFDGAGQNKVQDKPVLFDGDLKNSTPTIRAKAVSARFVKVV
ncbi:MAG: hypothetical protein DRH97_00345 [Chloroflexi bacterium]|nr:MAG: hypothetical protein DRH97_00345 [Chloroflexota bacterium]